MKNILYFLFIVFLFSCSEEIEEPVLFNLTATAVPNEGGRVSPTDGQYKSGDVAKVTATPSADYVFQSWSGSSNGTSPSTTITMDSDKVVAANFVKKQYPLTIEVEGEGSVSESVINQALATNYDSGSVVELKAVPADGWEFIEWSGDLTGSENPKQIIIDKATNVKVKFAVRAELSIDFKNTNGLLISKAKTITTSATAASNNDYNAKLINFNGELTELVIPGSISHTLNITRALELNEQFLLLFGSLSVQYEGDVNGDGVNGDSINYNNIIIDKSTGNFYEAGYGFGGIRGEGIGNPWLNQMFQYDNKDNIYYKNQEGISSNSIQVIDKLNLSVSDSKIISNREKLNIISEDYSFFNIVGGQGILYKSDFSGYNNDKYGFRNNNGKTYILNEDPRSDPFVYENQSSDVYNENGTFFLQGTNKEILVFKHIGEIGDQYGSAIGHKYAILHIYEGDSGGIYKQLIKEFDYKPETFGFDTGVVGYHISGPIIDNYDQSPMYFRRTDSKDNQVTHHIIINSNFGNYGTLITKFTQGRMYDEFNVTGIFSDKLNESQYFDSFNNEAYTALDDYVLFAVNQKVIKFDFNPLKVEYLIENSGYEFYKLAPAYGDEFYFYGLSYENGKRTLGKINLEGTIEVIEQFDNDIDLLKLIKIGNEN